MRIEPLSWEEADARWAEFQESLAKMPEAESPETWWCEHIAEYRALSLARQEKARAEMAEKMVEEMMLAGWRSLGQLKALSDAFGEEGRKAVVPVLRRLAAAEKLAEAEQRYRGLIRRENVHSLFWRERDKAWNNIEDALRAF